MIPRPQRQSDSPEITGGSSQWLLVIGFWLLVSAPLAWGVYNTLLQAVQLFK